MDINDLQAKLIGLYAQYINKSSIQNGNELCVEINMEISSEICIFLNKSLGFSLISMFANDERREKGKFAIYYVFADRVNGLLLIIKSFIEEENPHYYSIAGEIYASAAYEREIFDLYGIKALEHPGMKRLIFHGNWPDDLYPLRKDFNRGFKPPFEKKGTEFTRVEGEGVFEIPVGPVHAGIIEPGHFRFSVVGEPVINLEAQLYFVHKGIEKMCEGLSIEKCYYVSERISGDETFSNSLAYCQAIEKIAGAKVPERAEFIRVIFAELERITSHLGDLAGVCLDVAYGFAAYQFRMMRGWAYIIADELCGMRFLRSVNKPGGIRKDFVMGKEAILIDFANKLKKELQDTVAIINANSMFIDRIENTGVLKNSVALDLNVVGPAGRASGVQIDVRKDFPYGAYSRLDFKIPEHANGDVNCRMHVKIEECFESISLILQAIEKMPGGRINEPIGDIEPFSFGLGITESPRGENTHFIMIGENNTIFRYKIRTASFCNWPAVCEAVKGNIVTDFPLINKSFNLSYAGNDL